MSEANSPVWMWKVTERGSQGVTSYVRVYADSKKDHLSRRSRKEERVLIMFIRTVIRVRNSIVSIPFTCHATRQ